MREVISADWKPLGLTYRVEQLQAPEKSKGGIFLPQGTPLEATEALVVCRGTGRRDEGRSGRYRFQAREGERVLFERINFSPVGDEGEGVLGDEDLIGIRIPDSPGIQPCNDWLLLRMPGRIRETSGGLHVPERCQKRSDHGVVVDYGPGKLRWKGPLEGTRVTCGELLDAASFGDVRGLSLYWRQDARLLEVTGGEPGLLLVRAANIVAVGESEDGERFNRISESVSSQSSGIQTVGSRCGGPGGLQPGSEPVHHGPG